MRASPYDALAYRPATINALTSASIRRTWLLRRYRHDRRARCLVLRPDEDRLAAGEVLGHHIGVVRLPGLVELDRPAGEDGLVPRGARERVVDLLLVEAPGLLDSRIQDPRRLPAGGGVPLGVVAGLLPRRDPLLHEITRLLLVEPHRGGNVVRRRTELVLRRLIRAARPVRDEEMLQAQLSVLPLHGDV